MKTDEDNETQDFAPAINHEVVEGDEIVINRRGLPGAESAPATLDRESVHAKIDEWFEYRDKAGITLGDLTYRDLIDEGRRY